MVEHPGHQALLIIGAARTVLEIVNCARIRVGPAIKVFLDVSRDRAEFRLLAAGRHDELVVEKKLRVALALGSSLFAVAEQLVDRLGDGILDFGRLALNNDHRQAVQKQHDIRIDVVLCPEDPDLELTDGDEPVVVSLFEVDEPDRRALLAGLAVLADAGILQ